MVILLIGRIGIVLVPLENILAKLMSQHKTTKIEQKQQLSRFVCNAIYNQAYLLELIYEPQISSHQHYFVACKQFIVHIFFPSINGRMTIDVMKRAAVARSEIVVVK